MGIALYRACHVICETSRRQIDMQGKRAVDRSIPISNAVVAVTAARDSSFLWCLTAYFRVCVSAYSIYVRYKAWAEGKGGGISGAGVCILRFMLYVPPHVVGWILLFSFLWHGSHAEKGLWGTCTVALVSPRQNRYRRKKGGVLLMEVVKLGALHSWFPTSFPLLFSPTFLDLFLFLRYYLSYVWWYRSYHALITNSRVDSHLPWEICLLSLTPRFDRFTCLPCLSSYLGSFRWSHSSQANHTVF